MTSHFPNSMQQHETLCQILKTYILTNLLMEIKFINQQARFFKKSFYDTVTHGYELTF